MSLLPQVPCPPEQSLPGGATATEIDRLEAFIGRPLPSELRDWLGACNAPLVGPGGLYGVLSAEKFLSIQAHLESEPGWIDRGWIPIAGDGCGNEYVLDTRTGTDPHHPIYFLDHEQTLLEPVYVVAVGLWRFLELLLQTELDHEQGLPSWWPFNKQQALAINPELAEYRGNIPLAWETVKK